MNGMLKLCAALLGLLLPLFAQGSSLSTPLQEGAHVALPGVLLLAQQDGRGGLGRSRGGQGQGEQTDDEDEASDAGKGKGKDKGKNERDD